MVTGKTTVVVSPLISLMEDQVLSLRSVTALGQLAFIIGPIANLKGHYFQPSLSVCLCVLDRHFYPSALNDFDETWSQGPYSDLVWPRP